MKHSRAVLTALVVAAALVPAAGRTAEVAETVILNNERVMVIEYVFPPGFKGEEHAAATDEFAYVLEGEFTVVTRGQGRRVVKQGEVEYAAKWTMHLSANETSRPVRVLVVMLKGR